jgi:hypothetical protein
MATATLTPRRAHPAFALPGAMDAPQALGAASKSTDLPETTLYLVQPPQREDSPGRRAVLAASRA